MKKAKERYREKEIEGGRMCNNKVKKTHIAAKRNSLRHGTVSKMEKYKGKAKK